MCNPFFRWGRWAVLWTALVGAAHAFIIIDPTGTWELISPGDFSNKPASGWNRSRTAKLSTKDKSLTAFLLWHQGKPSEDTGARTFTGGVELKVAEPDGLSQFLKFEKMPTWEVGGLVNWSGHPPPLKPLNEGEVESEVARWTSFTLQAGYREENIDYLPLSANPDLVVKTVRNGAAFARATVGVYFNGVPVVKQFAILLKAEAQRQSNYTDLPKVGLGNLAATLPPDAEGNARTIVANAKTLRRGDLVEDTTYPLTVGAVFTVDANWALKLPGLGDDDAAANATGQFYFTPYYRLTPSADSGTARAYGLNIAFRKKEENKVTIPFNVFVERGRKFASTEWETTTGVSTVFSWGPP